MKTKMKLVKWEVRNKEVKPEIKSKQMIIPKIKQACASNYKKLADGWQICEFSLNLKDKDIVDNVQYRNKSKFEEKSKLRKKSKKVADELIDEGIVRYGYLFKMY